ncbi:MAG: hypothetical protein HYY84_18880 [Deltaproteobacteria bacterium]|nr:hypothetical protein [Deltaproteobacteria bacterium]
MSCAVPAPIDGPADETAASPRIVWTTVDPPVGLVSINQSATSTEFRIIQVDDPNVADKLTIRFFVDYHRDTTIQREFTLLADPGSTTPTIRTGVIFSAPTALFGSNPTASAHLVEAIVSDRGFSDTGQTTNINRNVPSDARTDYIAWTVQVVP